MVKFVEKLKKFWYFNLSNPVIRKGERGGFKWTFKRFWLDVETVSGNWKMRFIANEHPYGYLVSGKDDNNIVGYCATMYYLSQTLTTDQGLVSDVEKALKKFEKRVGMAEMEPEEEEAAAMEEVKSVQDLVEMPQKARRKAEKDIDRRFKASIKKANDKSLE